MRNDISFWSFFLLNFSILFHIANNPRMPPKILHNWRKLQFLHKFQQNVFHILTIKPIFSNFVIRFWFLMLFHVGSSSYSYSMSGSHPMLIRYILKYGTALTFEKRMNEITLKHRLNNNKLLCLLLLSLCTDMNNIRLSIYTINK